MICQAPFNKYKHYLKYESLILCKVVYVCVYVCLYVLLRVGIQIQETKSYSPVILMAEVWSDKEKNFNASL